MEKDFYASVISRAQIGPDDSILVVCGGPYDHQTLLASGCKSVVISNLDHHDNVVSDYSPYSWLQQDAENITLQDGSVDWVIVSAGLHHCGSPHRALCEMLRVARRGVIVLEARDSALMRVAVRLGLTPEYELEPIALSGSRADISFGGWRNSFIPNYIYRWTEREVIKTTASFLPQYQHEYQFFYGLRLPLQRMAMARNPIKRAVLSVLAAVGWFFETFLPHQGNMFAFKISKGGKLQPWMREVDGKLDIDTGYMAAMFDPNKYKKG